MVAKKSMPSHDRDRSDEDSPSEGAPETIDGLPVHGQSTAESADSPAPARQLPDDFPIVGIGASAGGLEALEVFFANLPADSGMAFVVVQHLSPDFKSMMDELLARHTRIPIHRASNGMQILPNAIYLMPPKKEMIISGGRLLLSDKDPGSGLTLPIDVFFRSLAQDVGARAIGIVLSGTGSDGSRGITDIHAAGGLVIAQDLDSAKFDGMPKSAAETGVVGLVLPPEQMASAIAAYLKHPGSADFAEFMPTNPALLQGFDAIFQLLRKAFDIDFSYYKRTTVTRRVQRRLGMLQITDLNEYVDLLRSDTNELNLLYRDLLIGVTKFFRDADAFRLIEQEVLPQAISKIRPDDELRIWVAGCATGEEAYSLAILASEQLERHASPVRVKIFATDVHRVSLEFASTGIYSDSSVSEVSSERLQNFFTRVRGGYQVSQALRQMIVFAPHNVIKDAPFTKIDLITCRNMLIYLEAPAQKKAISLFHFGLKAGGVMCMGPSESPGDLLEEFAPISDRWKIYRKRRDMRLPTEMRLPLSSGNLRQTERVISPLPQQPDPSLIKAYDQLLRECAPPSFLISHRRELLQSFGGASEFLKLRDGRPTSDVCELVLPELTLPLSSALQQCAKKKNSVSFRGIHLPTVNEEAEYGLTVKLLGSRNDDTDWFLATITSDTSLRTAPADVSDAASVTYDQAANEQLQALEAELSRTKENLQATVEEMETSNEELQATNEELVASNEELQSTNEELHSVNEELYTVNAEYQKKIGELTEMTTDLDNLLRSTDIGVIFLDHDLCIRKFTPRIAEVFHLLPVDIGRGMGTFANTLRYPELMESLKGVLREEVPVEAEVEGDHGTVYLLRILPYRYKGRMEGLVLTLIDVSRLKQVESGLRTMSKVFLDGADPIVIEDLNGQIVDLNREAERVFGWNRDAIVGQNVEILIPHQELVRARELRARCLEKGGLRNVETVKHNRLGEVFPVLLSLSVLTDREGKALAIASNPKDITDRKRAEKAAGEAVAKRDQFLAMLSHELRNPLGAALNATYLLQPSEDSGLSEPQRQACSVIQRQILQVSRLLDDLLDVSRVTQGRIEIRRQVVDLTQLVNDALQAVRPQIDARAHMVKTDIARYPVCVEGDPARILQVQENLLANAAKYTPNGGTIGVSLHKEDGEAVYRVRDNGNGIEAKMLDSIFELFVQAENTIDRAHGGMGLGLTLVKRLVHLHGGSISAQSPGINRGSEFVVRLPLARDQSHVVLTEVTDGEATRTKHIVLVEDNDDSREMLATLLRLEGHQVAEAADGMQGLELILHQRPDVGIVDIGLPRLCGYDVAREVRQQLGDHVRLIALTGYGREEDQEAARKAGFDLHLVKPLKPTELTKVLNSIP